jgi:hypothetical protein
MLRPTIAVMGLLVLAAACGDHNPPKTLPATLDAASLPPGATDALNDHWPKKDWSIATIGSQTSSCLAGKPNATAVSADFDSDGLADLALLVKTPGGVRLVVLLARGDQYAVFDVDAMGDQDASAGLGLAKRGTKFAKTTSLATDFYPADTLTTYVCSGPQSSYLWGGLNFYKVDLRAAAASATARSR